MTTDFAKLNIGCDCRLTKLNAGCDCRSMQSYTMDATVDLCKGKHWVWL